MNDLTANTLKTLKSYLKKKSQALTTPWKTLKTSKRMNLSKELMNQSKTKKNVNNLVLSYLLIYENNVQNADKEQD